MLVSLYMEGVHPLFFHRWSSSREENTAGVIVYRPGNFPFPPARFREAIEFHPDGSVTYFGLGGDDRSVKISGHWDRINETVVRTEFADSLAPSSEWKLTEGADSFPKLEVAA